MNKKMIAGVAIAAVAMLALMGLAFCWLCPDVWVCRAEKLGAHWAFWRQLAWNAVGVLAFVLAFAALATITLEFIDKDKR